MRLSTKGRYAVTAMIDLAINDKQGPTTLADISYCQGISLSYLEQLFAKLRKADLVEGLRGPGGGYRLGMPSSEISMADIILAVDENMDSTQCKGKEDCNEGDRCLTHELWQDLSSQIQDFLSGISLAEIVERPGVQELIRQREALPNNLLNHRRNAA